MELSKSASALGLYKYNCDLPQCSLFRRFHSAVLDLFGLCGIVPTYFGAEGPDYPNRLTKITEKAYSEMLHSDFARITGVSLHANPPRSDTPAYDSFGIAALNYTELNRELLAWVVINEAFVSLRSSRFDLMLRSQIELCRWDFGYGFTSSVEKRPELHIIGFDNGTLTAAEYNSLCTWCAANGKDRTALLRDIYPYNILNERQLNAQVSDGVSLRQFAASQPDCTLIRLTVDGLYLWQVPDAEVVRLRKALDGSPVLLS